MQWWKWKESNFHCTPYEDAALPLCYTSMVPGARFELATNALSRRCSTTELSGYKTGGSGRIRTYSPERTDLQSAATL